MLTVPTTVAPRFIPSNDGSQEAQKIASIQHDFTSPVKMTLTLEVLMKIAIASVTSPSHSITTTEQKKEQEYHVQKMKFSATTSDMDRFNSFIITIFNPIIQGHGGTCGE